MNINKINYKQYEVEGNLDTYKVTLDPFSCTCRDYLCRREPIGTFCKHIKEVIKIIEK